MIRPLAVVLATLATLSTIAGTAAASPLVRLDVVDRDSGRWLAQYPERGETWIAGTPGHRYAVRLTNTSGERVLVVLSVDGVNAVTGQTAHPAQTGYVLAPWQSTEINGWRKSYRDVAQFVFTALPDSYAARTGRPDHVGTIGIAVFRERVLRPAPLPSPPIARGKSRVQQEASPSAAMEDRVAQQIGTGHGEREWSPVGQTDFLRASSRPDQVSQLRYDDSEALAARGILPRPAWTQRPRHARPQAFPGAFVPDPPARRR